MSRFPALTNQILVLLLLIVVIFASLGVGWSKRVGNVNQEIARAQMNDIYNALQRYETRNGALPVLAFYPLEPISGTDSIRYELTPYVADPKIFVSPAGHPLIKQTGLTYVWNPKFNGGRLEGEGEKEWILIDIQALHPNSSKAHSGGYMTLYSDGTTSLEATTPASLFAYLE